MNGQSTFSFIQPINRSRLGDPLPPDLSVDLPDAIASLRDRFHYIVLDCPPALDLLTLNALVAADSVLIPIQCEFFALEGISQLMDTIDGVRQSFATNVKVEGVLLTMYDDRTTGFLIFLKK